MSSSTKKATKVRATDTADTLDSTGRQRQLKRDEVGSTFMPFFFFFLSANKQTSKQLNMANRLFVKN